MDDESGPVSSLPQLLAAEASEKSTPAPVPVSPLPPALVERVQSLAAEYRASTGRAADADTVRTRLGLPASMTPSVAAHL
ncbi:hypothetical protein [Streptomyces sp. NPDC014894]|uniref:hypothetical protein n=1 Tax=Streptomyces sp. NPDC014894 TaxID=3364931 RepID=UPI0036F7AA0A